MFGVPISKPCAAAYGPKVALLTRVREAISALDTVCRTIHMRTDTAIPAETVEIASALAHDAVDVSPIPHYSRYDIALCLVDGAIRLRAVTERGRCSVDAGLGG